MRNDSNIFVSRYGDGPLPKPGTMCAGACEGTGWVPVRANDDEYADDWRQAEEQAPTDDGWHFVPCHDCGGTGQRKA